MDFLVDSSDSSSDESSSSAGSSSNNGQSFDGVYLPDNNAGDAREITFQLEDLSDILQCQVTDARTIPGIVVVHVLPSHAHVKRKQRRKKRRKKRRRRGIVLGYLF